MRNPLNKRLIKDLKSHGGRYAAIFIIFVVMVTIISTFLVVANGVALTYEHNHIDAKLEDAQFSTYEEIEETILTKVEKKDIIISDQRYVDIPLSIDAILRIYKERDKINLPVIWEGNIPKTGNEIALPLYKKMYYGAYSLPPMELHFNLEALILTTLLPIIVILILNIAVVARKLSLSPLRFLRRDLKHSKKKRSFRLPDFSFLSRFRIRVILQNIGSYVMLFFGMLFASFILLFGLCMPPTIEHYITSIEDAAVSEYQYILKAPYEIDEDDNTEAFSFGKLEIFYPAADKKLEVAFYGISDDSQYWDIDTTPLKKDTVIVSEELLKKMGMSIGDRVTFEDPYSEKDYSLTIAATKPYPIGFTVFMKLERLNDMLERKPDTINGYLSNQKLDIPKEQIATVITPEDISGMGEQMLTTFSDMGVICLSAAIVIYLVLMYIPTKIIVDKNTQNISFMKVMGYQEKEIRKLYLTPTIIAVIISLLLSLPLIGLGIQGVFALAFTDISGYLEAHLPWYLFAIITATGVVSYLMINLLHMRRIRRIDMAEVLKNRE